MTTVDRKRLEVNLRTRARELARTLAERNQIAIERAADVSNASLLAAERESSARTLEQDFRLTAPGRGRPRPAPPWHFRDLWGLSGGDRSEAPAGDPLGDALRIVPGKRRIQRHARPRLALVRE